MALSPLCDPRLHSFYFMRSSSANPCKIPRRQGRLHGWNSFPRLRTDFIIHSPWWVTRYIVSLYKHEFLTEEHLSAQSFVQLNVATRLQPWLFIPARCFSGDRWCGFGDKSVFFTATQPSLMLSYSTKKRKTLTIHVTFPTIVCQCQKGDRCQKVLAGSRLFWPVDFRFHLAVC